MKILREKVTFTFWGLTILSWATLTWASKYLDWLNASEQNGHLKFEVSPPSLLTHGLVASKCTLLICSSIFSAFGCEYEHKRHFISLSEKLDFKFKVRSGREEWATSSDEFNESLFISDWIVCSSSSSWGSIEPLLLMISTLVQFWFAVSALSESILERGWELDILWNRKEFVYQY